MLKKDDAVYTRGSIQGTMLKTGCAMLAGTLAMSGYNIADTYFVGQLGKSPLAAMGFTFPVIMLIGCVFRGIVMKALLDTILHETFHALQRRAIVRPSRYGIPKAEAQIWRINFHNYIQPEQNPERYWLQPVEVTARVFAAQILNHFYD